MKRKLFFTFLIVMLALPVLNLSAQEAEQNLRPIGLDVGAVVSTGYLSGTGYDFVDILSPLFLLRAGVTVTGRYRINETFSTGLELGFTALSTSTDDGGTKAVVFDMPINAVFRIGGKTTFIEPHLGYYLSTFPVFSLGGFSVGAKGSLGGFYVDVTYVIGAYKYPRFGIGWQWNNIF
ncbi:MAG: hypothetical protein JXR86_07035 [Spirochaetales bacterium]|nr:hypothetical protein [Spirochaetales bacterium]